MHIYFFVLVPSTWDFWSFFVKNILWNFLFSYQVDIYQCLLYVKYLINKTEVYITVLTRNIKLKVIQLSYRYVYYKQYISFINIWIQEITLHICNTYSLNDSLTRLSRKLVWSIISWSISEGCHFTIVDNPIEKCCYKSVWFNRYFHCEYRKRWLKMQLSK